MEMVVHKDIGLEDDRVDVLGLEENAQKRTAVVIISEDISSLVSATRHMVYRARILNSQRSGHTLFYSGTLGLSTVKI